MAPNPIMLPRKRAGSNRVREDRTAPSLTSSLFGTSLVVVLIATTSWARRWLLSGCAVETILLLIGTGTGSRIFPSAPLWTLISSINLIYAIASTSWLLFGAFALACWPFVFLTSLSQFEFAGDLVRKSLRLVLRDLHFTRDRIALFNLPALEIDTDVSGLMVIRGVTISLSKLTIIAHGVEVGIKLADEIELAIHADEVRVPLFRGIEIGDVYANIKGGKAEMTFAEVEEEDEADDDGFFNETPLLRAATAGTEGIKDRPKLRESLAGGSYMKDASAKTGFDNIKLLSPDSRVAEQQYLDILTDIRTSSAVYQSRARVRQSRKKSGLNLDDEKDMRAAVCAELHDFPSVPHPPQHSVKVTTLQGLNKPWVQRLMHRMPFLLRALLGPLGYFHPITFASINAAGSGQWLKEILQQQLFRGQETHRAEIRRIQKRMSVWLADANFCLQLADIDALAQVPISTAFDIVAYLHFADIVAYRTVPQQEALDRVVRLAGADATFTIPIFLLPHHEHLIPARPTAEDEAELEKEVEVADGIPKTVQAEQQLERVVKDETIVAMSVHASLPAAFDQSLLMFVAALVKATKIIEFDKELDKLDSSKSDPDKQVDGLEPITRTSTSMSTDTMQSTESTHRRSKSEKSTDDSDSIKSLHKRVQTDLTGTSTSSRFKAFTKNLQQNLKEASISTAETFSKENINEVVRDVRESTRGMKKTVVGSIVNDRWIAKLVGKVAANLERAQGDLGYSGGIPISLEPYRAGPGGDGHLSKLLP